MISKSNLLKILKKGLNNSTITNVLTVAIITLFVRGLSFTKEIIIADGFGLSELLDTFYIAILIPSFISGVFLGSFKSVFIPNYIGELSKSDDVGSFQTASFIVTFGTSIFFLIIAILFTDIYLETFFDGHTQNYYSLIKLQFYYVMPCIVFWGFSSILGGLLTIDNEFTFSSLSIIFTPISIIICILFFKEELGTIVLAVGTLIGSALGFLFLLFIVLKRKLLKFKKPDFKSPNIIILFKQLPAKLSSGLLSGVNPIIDQYFSAQLIIGSIAALNYGVKIPMFSIGIVGSALGSVLLPYFSKKAIENRTKTFNDLKKTLKYIAIGSIILTVILIFLSKPIISLIFERNSFTHEDTLIVSKIQQMYLLQIPSYITGLIMVRFLTSINKNNFMVFTSILSLTLNILLNIILIEKMGVYGLALATSIVSFVNSIILYIYINKLNKANV